MASVTVAVIGAGNIGRAWTICFARGGARCRLFDVDRGALEHALVLIRQSLSDLEECELIDDAESAYANIEPVSSLEAALDGTDYVQESVLEDLELKRQLFAQLDAIAAPGVPLASSSSEFMTSEIAASVDGAHRCLVAHPFNPPYLIPLVELSGGPATDAATIDTARKLLAGIGMSPVVVRKEIKALLLNRLQAAVVTEALHLVGEGYCSATDLDSAMENGLALRWAFMGPFLTGHLNATGGYSEYMRTFGDTYRRTARDLDSAYGWSLELIDRVHAELSGAVPTERVESAQRWRDRRLMALLKHKASEPSVKPA